MTQALTTLRRLGERVRMLFMDASTIDMIISFLDSLCPEYKYHWEGETTHCLLHLDEVLYSQYKL